MYKVFAGIVRNFAILSVFLVVLQGCRDRNFAFLSPREDAGTIDTLTDDDTIDTLTDDDTIDILTDDDTIAPSTDAGTIDPPTVAEIIAPPEIAEIIDTQMLGGLLYHQLANVFPDNFLSCGDGCYANTSSDLIDVKFTSPESATDEMIMKTIADLSDNQTFIISFSYPAIDKDLNGEIGLHYNELKSSTKVLHHISGLIYNVIGDANTTDFLGAGSWIVAPKNFSSFTDQYTHFGAFVINSGGEQSQTMIPTNLNGKFKYEGNVLGFFSPIRQNTHQFNHVNGYKANIALIAQFNNQPSISGTIGDYNYLPPESDTDVGDLPDLKFNIQIDPGIKHDFNGYLFVESGVSKSSVGFLNGKFYRGTDQTPQSVAGKFTAVTDKAMMAGVFLGNQKSP